MGNNEWFFRMKPNKINKLNNKYKRWQNNYLALLHVREVFLCQSLSLTDKCTSRNDSIFLRLIRPLCPSVLKSILFDVVYKLKIKGLPRIIIINKNIKVLKDEKKHKKFLIMNELHILPIAGHAGIPRTLNTIRQKYTWKGIEADVRKMVTNCNELQMYKKKNDP